MIAHCESTGDRMAILDAPPDLLPQEILEWRMSTAGLRLEVRDALLPLARGDGPDHEAADAWSRRRATWPASGPAPTRPAASTRRRPTRSCWASNGLAFQITHEEQGALNQAGINCIRAFPGRGIRVWGARTLSSDPEWRYLNVRRLFNYISESIMRRDAVGGVRAQRRAAVERSCGSRRSNFLTRTWREGALFGATPEQAFYVKCDDETNPPEYIEAGQVVIEIGIAPGEAGRVRDLPDQPVHRRRRRGHGLTLGAAKGGHRCQQRNPVPPHTSGLTLGGHEKVGVFREASGFDSETEVDRAQVGRRERATRSRARSPATHEVVEHHAQARRRREPRALEVARQVIKEGPDKARVDGTIELLDYKGTAIATYKFLAGLADQVQRPRRSTRRRTTSPSRRSRSATRASSGLGATTEG